MPSTTAPVFSKTPFSSIFLSRSDIPVRREGESNPCIAVLSRPAKLDHAPHDGEITLRVTDPCLPHLRCGGESNPRVRVLQTLALPLGYRTNVISINYFQSAPLNHFLLYALLTFFLSELHLSYFCTLRNRLISKVDNLLSISLCHPL